MAAPGGGFSCSPANLAAIRNMVGAGPAAEICSSMDVAALDRPLTAVLRFLAAQQPERGAAAAAAAEDAYALNTVFVLFSGYLVFLMQAGFAMLCAGHVRVKNNMNILMKNLVDCAVGTLAWYLLGNGFAFGERNGRAGPFIGAGDFALSNTGSLTTGQSSFPLFFFHWAFSAAAATIVAGAVAERISFSCYIIYSTLMSSLVYPCVAHWMWTKWGWLSPLAEKPLLGSGAIDFAGGIVVHTVGGMAALIGTWFTGPRVGRFNIDGEACKGYRENNSNLVVLGTFLLWFGWYGFNPGSAAAVNTYASAALVSRAAVTTTIAAGTGGLAAMLITFAVTRRYDVMSLCNGVLCGLVAVTPACGVIDVWAAIIFGVLGSALFIGADALMLRAKLDDVVAAAPMHLGCGALGTLLVGFFARQEYVESIYSSPSGVGRRWGVLFGGDGRLLACQVIALLAVTAWVAVIFAPYFYIMRRFNLVRVPIEQEIAGLDASKYGVLTTNELPTMPKQRGHGL
ncbi:MAG: putative amt protein [Monoraphidium minutum]|nr:MAG: putative amt protein [Monoraphidium minutum]